ncbi:hypothetical protein GCM10027575_85340 [Phytohabitans suffuscus]
MRPAGSGGTPPCRSGRCATQCRTSSSRPRSGSGSTATTSSSPACATAPRSRSPGTAAPPPGNPVIRDEHYPPSARGERTPKATNPAEAEFLAIGPGAAAWLTEAAAVGAHRIRVKMADAVVLAKLHGSTAVDRALGTAAVAGRFGEGDLLAILTHHSDTDAGERTHPGEAHSLQPGTATWSRFGLTDHPDNNGRHPR